MNACSAPPTACDALCIGGINLDRKLKALEALHSGSSNPCAASESPGGVARNVVENLARLGLRVSLWGQIGRDAAAGAVLKPLRELGVETGSCMVNDAGHTGSYTALLDSHGQLVMGMADMVLTEMLTPELLEPVIAVQNAKLWMADMNLPAISLAWLARQAQAREQRLVMLAVSDPKMRRLPRDLRGVDTLVLNVGELAALGLPPNEIEVAFGKLHAQGLQRLVVTMGERGVKCMDYGQTQAVHVIPAIPQGLEIVDVSGAGDAFCAGLCASFLRYAEDTLAQHVQRAMMLSVLTVQSASTVSTAITPDLI
ncbi:MAG: carbohydrate kinase family protein [Brachymonas sp.]